jgi:hypothetical protein
MHQSKRTVPDFKWNADRPFRTPELVSDTRSPKLRGGYADIKVTKTSVYIG